ncbi:MAG TPA: cyanophycin synthetase, partial [Phycisphaerales bacterium]|nr:cyanophycin synthetase [Phycisphaerales bacterium]
GLSPEDGAELLSDFTGLPHRLQLVAEIDDCRFYNDSKSTTPEAALLAIDAFDEPDRIHLIAGGYDKGSDLLPVAQQAVRIAGLYTIGATGRPLAENANMSASIAGTATRIIECCETLENAVKHATRNMRAGDILLLSPACASWDQFTNYEERGEMFSQYVQQFAGRVNNAADRAGAALT